MRQQAGKRIRMRRVRALKVIPIEVQFSPATITLAPVSLARCKPWYSVVVD
jgi:hypothetical protein